MTQRKVGVTDVASGAGVADYRTREQAALGCEQYLIPQVDRVTSFTGMVASFRFTGTAVANRALATIFNVTGSGVLLAVRQLVLITDATAILTLVRTLSVSRITAAPTDGALGVPVGFDSAQVHDASVEFRGAASADGTNVALTAPAGAVVGRRTLTARPHKLDFQLLSPETTLIPDLYDPGILAAGEGIVVTAVEAGNTSAHFLLQAVFAEFTL
jgi:hypothetical protein